MNWLSLAMYQTHTAPENSTCKTSSASSRLNQHGQAISYTASVSARHWTGFGHHQSLDNRVWPWTVVMIKGSMHNSDRVHEQHAKNDGSRSPGRGICCTSIGRPRHSTAELLLPRSCSGTWMPTQIGCRFNVNNGYRDRPAHAPQGHLSWC